jgi:DNA-binding CsgD family transcriptional regulator
VASSGDLSPLSVLGFTPVQEDLYRVVLRNSGSTREELAELVARPLDAVSGDVRRFAALGLVDLSGDTVVALPPGQALLRVITEENRRLHSVGEQLESLRLLLPSLTAEHLSSQAPRGEPVSVEVLQPDEVIEFIRSLWPTTSGDLLWLRPDQWRYPSLAVANAWVEELVSTGRRSRAIYPARALEEAPEVVRARSHIGEHVRIVADLPLRVAVLGDTAAVVGEPIGDARGRALVVRQELMVRALRLYFECLWDKAMAVPGLASQAGEEELSDRSLLLDQLAAGAKDEQIARALGLSLRTVRRRVAQLLDELGAGSRFQAGVEAVRRGWV